MAQIVLVKGYDFKKKINRTWMEKFKVDRIEVDSVVLEADKDLEKKLKDDPLFAQQLRDAATDHLDEVAKIIQRHFDEQVKKLEETLKLPEDPQKVLKKVQDIQHTVEVAVGQALKSAAKGAEQAVDKAFNDYLKRKKDATSYRRKFRIECTLTAIGLATGVTSLVLGAGAAAVAIVGVMNTLSKGVLQLREAARDVDQSSAELSKVVDKLAKDIDIEVGKSAKQAGVELAVAAVPVLTKMMSTISTADSRADELGAKIEKCDRHCSQMVGDVMKAIRKIDELEKDTRDLPKLAEKVKKLAAKNDELLKKVEALQPELKRQQAFQKAAAAQIAEWKAKRAKAAAIPVRALTIGEIGETVVSVFETALEVANALSA